MERGKASMRRDRVTDVDFGACPPGSFIPMVVLAPVLFVAELVLISTILLCHRFALIAPEASAFLCGTLLFTLIAALAFCAFERHRDAWSDPSAADRTAVVEVIAWAVAFLVFAVVSAAWLAGVPHSVPVTHWFILAVGLSASWLGYRSATVFAYLGHVCRRRGATYRRGMHAGEATP